MNKSSVILPETMDEAWLNLATDVLLLAIEDVRHNRNPEKREWAKGWLLSPAAELFFDTIISPGFDVQAWVKSDCPMMDNR
jgi:hypothetical protein